MATADTQVNAGTTEKLIADREARNTAFDILQVAEAIRALLQAR